MTLCETTSNKLLLGALGRLDVRLLRYRQSLGPFLLPVVVLSGSLGRLTVLSMLYSFSCLLQTPLPGDTSYITSLSNCWFCNRLNIWQKYHEKRWRLHRVLNLHHIFTKIVVLLCAYAKGLEIKRFVEFVSIIKHLRLPVYNFHLTFHLNETKVCSIFYIPCHYYLDEFSGIPKLAPHRYRTFTMEDVSLLINQTSNVAITPWNSCWDTFLTLTT